MIYLTSLITVMRIPKIMMTSNTTISSLGMWDVVVLVVRTRVVRIVECVVRFMFERVMFEREARDYYLHYSVFYKIILLLITLTPFITPLFRPFRHPGSIGHSILSSCCGEFPIKALQINFSHPTLSRIIIVSDVVLFLSLSPAFSSSGVSMWWRKELQAELDYRSRELRRRGTASLMWRSSSGGHGF